MVDASRLAQWAVADDVAVPNAAMIAKKGSPTARLASRILPAVSEFKKITWPTPVMELSHSSFWVIIFVVVIVVLTVVVVVVDGFFVSSSSCELLLAVRRRWHG